MLLFYFYSVLSFKTHHNTQPPKPKASWRIARQGARASVSKLPKRILHKPPSRGPLVRVPTLYYDREYFYASYTGVWHTVGKLCSRAFLRTKHIGMVGAFWRSYALLNTGLQMSFFPKFELFEITSIFLHEFFFARAQKKNIVRNTVHYSMYGTYYVVIIFKIAHDRAKK